MLTKGDLDWDGSVIRAIHGKGQKERQVPFDRHCQRAMLRFFQRRTDALDWLWITEEGARLGYDGIWKDLKRLAERAELDLQDTCHIFRRTFAANAVRQKHSKAICPSCRWLVYSPDVGPLRGRHGGRARGHRSVQGIQALRKVVGLGTTTFYSRKGVLTT